MLVRSPVKSVVLLAAIVGGCQRPSADIDTEDPIEMGVVQLSISSVPSDVGCIQILVSDGLRSLTRRVDVVGLSNVSTTQTGLPLGPVSIGVDAFATACVGVNAASVATWTGGVAHATLVAGMPAAVPVTMTRTGSASIGVSFPSGGGGCGDGLLGVGETCDDSNTISGDGCSSMCRVEPGWVCPAAGVPCAQQCGDGIRTVGEQCDLGSANNTGAYGGCNPDCTLAARCGDGVKNGPEGCDDGVNAGGYGVCAPGCVLGPRCGDGVVNGPEQCDDGNAVSGDGCTPMCTAETTHCGNGVVDPGEQCDDGMNTGAYGGCNANCTLAARCGDGIKNGPEACDNGMNTGAYGTCNANCTLAPFCGDALVNGPEQCDLGSANGHGTGGAGCSATCTPEYRLYREAESATVASPLQSLADMTASGGHYVQVAPGTATQVSPPTHGILSYTFSISTIGKYRVFGRFTTPTTSDDSFFVRMDSGAWVLWNDIFTRIGATPWRWDEVHDTGNANAIVQFTLMTAGNHTLQIAYREDGAKLDRIFITNDPSPALVP